MRLTNVNGGVRSTIGCVAVAIRHILGTIVPTGHWWGGLAWAASSAWGTGRGWGRGLGWVGRLSHQVSSGSPTLKSHTGNIVRCYHLNIQWSLS